MLRTARRLAPIALTGVLLAGGAAACDDAAEPKGTNGTITARAYVDRDASGTFTAADSALAGVAVTLLRDGQSVQTGTTGTDGKVTFSNVEPGSYQVSAPTAPAGSALTTNSMATAAVSFQGSAPSVEFRFVFFPAAISGRVYKDDNGNGTFDSATDTPGGGILVRIYASNNGVQGAVVDSTTTDQLGAYTFPRLAPGNYIVQVVNPNPEDPNFFGTTGNSRTIAAAPGTTSSAASNNVTFVGSLAISIAQARARTVGQRVTVQGDVTAPPGAFTSSAGVNSEIFIQDATGGISVFSVPTADSALYRMGQRVEVTGVIAAFNGQLQISAPTGGALTIVRKTGGAAILPRLLTAAEVKTLTAAEGQLVGIGQLEVRAVQTGTSTTFNVTTVAPGTTDTVIVRVQAAAPGTLGATRADFPIGKVISVVGELSQNTPTGAPARVPTVRPRFRSDVGIGATRLLPSTPAVPVTIEGVITVPAGNFSSAASGSSEVWVQDPAGGIAVFPGLFGPTVLNPLALGDSVRITGITSTFANQEQVAGNTANPLVITKLGTGTVPAPITVTGAQVNAFQYEGRLVRLPDFTVTTVATGTATAFNVTGTTADGQTVTIRVSGTNGGITRANFVIGSKYTITGILTQNNALAQIKVRFATDVAVQP